MKSLISYSLWGFYLVQMCFSLAFASGLKSDFKIFDGTLYSQKTQLERYGIRSLKIIYASALWPGKKSRNEVPAISDINKLVNDFKLNPTELLCLDIEHWNIHGDEKDTNIEKYEKTVQLFKKSLKDTQLGYYGLMPQRNYWASMKDIDSKENLRWKHTNTEHIDFVNKNLDVVFPSLYTFYTNQEDWKKFAIEHIAEAKKYGKPVYVFLWPLYHESNLWRKHDYIGDKYWRLQLETAYKYADGVVIWGGWDFENKRPMKWDESAAWWLETKKFLRSN